MFQNFISFIPTCLQLVSSPKIISNKQESQHDERTLTVKTPDPGLVHKVVRGIYVNGLIINQDVRCSKC